MEIKYESELCHYGVLGMKWGRRKNSEPIGYQSLRTKRLTKWYNRLSDEPTDKRKKVAAKLKGSIKIDKAVYNLAEAISDGRSFIKANLLTTEIRNREIDRALLYSRSIKKGKGIVAKMLDAKRVWIG